MVDDVIMNDVSHVLNAARYVESFQSKAQMVFYAVRDAHEKLITTEAVLLCDIRPCRGFDYGGVLVRGSNILLEYHSEHERYEFVADPYLFTLSEPEQITEYWYRFKQKENKRLVEEADKKLIMEEAEEKAKAEKDEEYATYLRLKEKFEGKDIGK